MILTVFDIVCAAIIAGVIAFLAVCAFFIADSEKEDRYNK